MTNGPIFTSTSTSKYDTNNIALKCYNGDEKLKNLNQSLSSDSMQDLQLVEKERKSSVKRTKNIILNGTKVQTLEIQHNLHPMPNIRFCQKQFRSINSQSESRKINRKDGAVFSKSKSLSSPQLLRKSRTISEKDEEDDKVLCIYA